MPLDPAISLAAGQGLPQQQPILGGNPIGSALTMMQIQNAANQNRLFQQTFAARQQMGEIMASAPSTEAGLQQILQSPAAPFAGEFLNSIRAAQQAMVGMQGEQQKQAQSGLEAVMHMLPSVYANPTNGQWQTSMNVATQGLSPYAMQASKGAIESIRQGLMENLPADQNAAAGVVRQRIGALLYSSNMTPDQMYALGGVIRPQTIQTADPITGQPRIGVVGGPPFPQGAIGPFPQGQGGGYGAIQGGPGASLAAPGSSIAAGPTPSQTDLIKAADAHKEELDSAVEVGGHLVTNLKPAWDALQSFTPGGGMEMYGKIARGIQAIPDAIMDPQTKQYWSDKVAGGNLGDVQAFQKYMLDSVLAEAQQGLKGIGGSRLSQLIFSNIQKALPTIESDPRAIDHLFRYVSQVYQIDRAEQSSFNDFRSKGGDVTQWGQVWQDIANKKGYIQPLASALGEPTELEKTGGVNAPRPGGGTAANPLAIPRPQQTQQQGGGSSLQSIFGNWRPGQ